MHDTTFNNTNVKGHHIKERSIQGNAFLFPYFGIVCNRTLLFLYFETLLANYLKNTGFKIF